MALTAYCKKCGQDVPVGDACPRCGARLAKTSVRCAWCVECTPVKDWACWNASLRIIVPAWAAVAALLMVLEGLLGGGLPAVERLLTGGVAWSLLTLLAVVLVLVLLVLTGQGKEYRACVLDSRGAHVDTWLPAPTAGRLLLRLKSPSLLRTAPTDPRFGVLISQREIGWKALSRVQLWPGKPVLVLSAPAWWTVLTLPCPPSMWEDALTFLRDKLGRRKDVLLPEELKAAPKPRKARAKSTQQTSFLDEPPAETALPPEQAEDMQALLTELHDGFEGPMGDEDPPQQ